MSELAKLNAFKVADHLQTDVALAKPVLFHVMQIFNISKSRLNQLDDWKEYEDPHNVLVDRISKSSRGQNRIIREVNLDEDASNMVIRNDGATYKLLLRDYTNNYCFAYELSPLPFLRNQTADTPLPLELGGRLLVKKGAIALSGVILLERNQCEYLGIDPEDKPLFDTLNNSIVKKYIDMLEKGEAVK